MGGLPLLLGLGLIAGVVSGTVGTGSSIILVPVLAEVYGPKEAVPIMAVAAAVGNFARILAWWREVDGRAFLAYAATGVPAAVLGARTMLALPDRMVDAAIGLFLLTMIPVRRWLGTHLVRLRLAHLAAAGAVIGYLTGIVVSTGPAPVPVFLGYGLLKGAFIGTEAAASLAVYLAKTLTFRGALMAGAFLAKPFVLRLTPAGFGLLMDGLLLGFGASLLWSVIG